MNPVTVVVTITIEVRDAGEQPVTGDAMADWQAEPPIDWFDLERGLAQAL